MLTGELRSQIDSVWNAFWSGGISNPMEVLEQITYLFFIRRLDDAHTLEESKAMMLKKPMVNRVFTEGKDPKGGDGSTYSQHMAAGEYPRDKHPELFNDSTSRRISTPACSTTTTSPSTVVHEAVELLLSKTQHARNGHPHFLFSPLSAK